MIFRHFKFRVKLQEFTFWWFLQRLAIFMLKRKISKILGIEPIHMLEIVSVNYADVTDFPQPQWRVSTARQRWIPTVNGPINWNHVRVLEICSIRLMKSCGILMQITSFDAIYYTWNISFYFLILSRGRRVNKPSKSSLVYAWSSSFFNPRNPRA